jgi:uncharacterized damage-inducible protein DinB
LRLNPWRGVSLPSFYAPETFPDLARLRARLDVVERETQDFVLACSEESLAKTVSYTNFRGEVCVYLLWQMILHQVNHATQHRSEIALIQNQCGHSPGAMDLLFFLDHESAQQKA